MIGTVVCVAGAMLLSFYHGHTIGIGESKIHWTYAQNITAHGSDSAGSNFFLGPFLIMAAAVSCAGWFIIQVTYYQFLSGEPNLNTTQNSRYLKSREVVSHSTKPTILFK